MANESSVLKVTAGKTTKKVTGTVSLLNDSGLPLFGSANLVVAGTTNIYTGSQTTRDTVRSEVGTSAAIGSLYLSTAGKIYLKVANADATADWQKVTATAAD